MSINQYNAAHELSKDEQAEVIEVAQSYDKTVKTVQQAVAYCIEDEEALEQVSHIADFGM